MPFCPQCGAKNAEDANFCNKCGSNIYPTAQPVYIPAAQSPAENKRKSFPWRILLAAILPVLLIVGALTADYVSDEEINLFGLLSENDSPDRDRDQEKQNEHKPSETTDANTSGETIPIDAETKPEETLPEESLPQDTLPAVTEPEVPSLEESKAILTQVMDGKHQLLTDSQSVMYLSEYLNVLEVNKIDWWEFVDFDQDGYPEVYAVTDSPIHSYLVLHWNGTQVCVFPFGARSMQTLKTNGWFSASSSAYESYYFRITFHGNSFTEHTLASFDTRVPVYQIDGKTVSKVEADQFLAQWNALPEVTRPGSTPPEETDPKARCAYCGVWNPLSQMKDGLCSECQGQAFQCQVCGKWSTTVFEGYCEECDPAQWGECPCCGAPLGYGEYDNAYGMCDSCLQNGGKCSACGKLTGYLDGGKCSSCQKPINTAACAYCGTETPIEDLKSSLCEECWYYRGVGWCTVCGRLSDNLFEGVCDVCEPWGGRGEPEECCVHCGQPSYDLVTGLCNDCYWYVGWCSVCGNLAYEIYDGVCVDCMESAGASDPDEYQSQCSVCGKWSDTVFEGICDDCGGYDGRG